MIKINLFKSLIPKPKEYTYAFEEKFIKKYKHYFNNLAIQIGYKSEIMEVFSKEARDRYNTLKATGEIFVIYLIDTIRNERYLYKAIGSEKLTYEQAILKLRLEGIISKFNYKE